MHRLNTKVRAVLLVPLLWTACAEYGSEQMLLALVQGEAASASSDWWDSSYARRRALVFDNSSRGALSNIPLLVQLDSSRIDYSAAASDGSDLCFVAAGAATGSAALAHEIESWNSSGTSYVWLNLESLPAGGSATIYMYYSGPTCSTTATSTWPAQYQSVWHFHNNANDATTNSHALAATGATQTTGLFGNAYSFDGASDQLEDADGEAYINGQAALSFSAWVQAGATGSDMGIFYTDTPAGSDSLPGLRHDQAGANGGCTNCLKASMGIGGTIRQLESSSNLQSTGWRHVVLVWQSGQQIQLYQNGVLDTPSDNEAAQAGVLANATTLLIGRGAKDTGTGSWNGLIDEVRITSSALSADWINAQYTSMTDAMTSYAGSDELR